MSLRRLKVKASLRRSKRATNCPKCETTAAVCSVAKNYANGDAEELNVKNVSTFSKSDSNNKSDVTEKPNKRPEGSGRGFHRTVRRLNGFALNVGLFRTIRRKLPWNRRRTSVRMESPLATEVTAPDEESEHAFSSSKSTKQAKSKTRSIRPMPSPLCGFRLSPSKNRNSSDNNVLPQPSRESFSSAYELNIAGTVSPNSKSASATSASSAPSSQTRKAMLVRQPSVTLANGYPPVPSSPCKSASVGDFSDRLSLVSREERKPTGSTSEEQRYDDVPNSTISDPPSHLHASSRIAAISKVLRQSAAVVGGHVSPSTSAVTSRRGSASIRGPYTEDAWSLAIELIKLSKYGWYWGPISRSEAEEKLLDQPDGAFLVRDSSDDHYLLSLSFRSLGKTLHTRIEYCNGVFSFYAHPEPESHYSIVELIEDSMSQSKSGVFCYSRARSSTAPTYPVRLKKPISRFTHVRTLQYLCRFVIRQYTRVDLIQQLPLPNRIKGYIEEGHY